LLTFRPAVAILYVSDHGSSVEHRRGVFLGGKIILGLSLGILNTTCQTYISEIAPPRLRGPLLSIFTFFLVLGQLIAIVIVFARVAILDPSAYRVCFAAQWSFAGMAVIVGILIPESPSYLVKRGEITKAERSYARLHSQAQAPTAIMALKQTIEAENEIAAFEAQSSYLECFKGSNWRRTRIIAYANALQQCLGVTLLSNSAYFLQLGGMWDRSWSSSKRHFLVYHDHLWPKTYFDGQHFHRGDNLVGDRNCWVLS
jgi:SP family general alpha glucoside:H+ symporter-like MFS transporter